MTYISFCSARWRPAVDPWPWYCEDRYELSGFDWFSCR